MAITISGENNNDKILASDGVIDQISGINIVGLITASHINVGSNIQLGNAGIITATTFNGNLTGNVNSTSPLLLQTGGSERFRITGDNALGIAGANYGSSGQVLTSGGSGSAVTWSTITSTTINNNADNRLITGSGTANTLNGESNLTFDGSTLGVNGNLSIAEKIIHTGDTNCFISFPAADQIVFEGGGHERFRINGTTGKYLFGRDITGRTAHYNNTGVVPTIQIEDDTEASFSVAKFSNNTDSSRIYLQKGRGSTGSAAVVQDNDTLGMIVFNGYNGSGFRNAAQITAEVDGTPTSSGDDTDMPGALVFKTSADGTNVPAERLRIDSGGRLQIGASNNTGSNTKFVIGFGNNLNTTALINTGDVDTNALTLSNWDGATTTNKVMIAFDNSGNGGFDIGMPAGSGDFAFQASGGERVRITSNGNILVGKTADAGKGLEVYASANAAIRIQNSSTGQGAADGLLIETSGSDALIWNYENAATRFATNNTERFRIDSAGRVMINQTTNLTGTAKLEVMGTGDNSYPQYSFAIGVADTQAYNVSNGTGMGIGFTYKHNTAGSYALGCGIRGFKENTTDGDYAGAMAFYTRANGAGAGERGRFSSAGTFGVGTANPDSNYKIDCNGKLRIGDGNAGHRIQFSRSGLGDELVLGVDGYGSSTNNEAVIQSSINSSRPLVLRTSNGDRLRIAANGRVGVWETEAKINTFAESLQVRALYGGGQYGIAVKLNQSSGSLMRFATKNPTNGNDDLCGNISGNGTSCSYNTSSDYRLKENDVKISDGISRLKQLRPIRFNWKSDSSFTQDGFFAHEVSPVVPESVTGEKDAVVDEIGEGYQNIDHSKLVPLLTAALQEAIARIEALEGS